MSADAVAHPVPSGVPVTDDSGNLDPAWYSFFVALWQRTGGNSGSIFGVLDNISNLPGAMLYRGAVSWASLSAGPPGKILQMGAAFPEWDTLNPAIFGAQLKNTFVGAPSGSNGPPAFRVLASADLNSVAGQIPGASDASAASAGNAGEYRSAQIASGSAIALTTGVASDIVSIALSPGDWDVWGNIATTAAVTTASAWINQASATNTNAPNSGAYAAWGAQTLALPIGMKRVSLASAGTAYLSINAAFGGVVSGFGFIGARRAR